MKRIRDETPPWPPRHPACYVGQSYSQAKSGPVGAWPASTSTTVLEMASSALADGSYASQQGRIAALYPGASLANNSKNTSIKSTPPLRYNYHSHSKSPNLPQTSSFLWSPHPPPQAPSVTAVNAHATTNPSFSTGTTDRASHVPVNRLGTLRREEGSFGQYYDPPIMPSSTWTPPCTSQDEMELLSNTGPISDLVLKPGEIPYHRSTAQSSSSLQSLSLENDLQHQGEDFARTYHHHETGAMLANAPALHPSQPMTCRFCLQIFQGSSARRNCSRHEQQKHAELLSPGSNGLDRACRQCGKIFKRGDACTKHERTHKELGLAPPIPRKKSNEIQMADVS